MDLASVRVRRFDGANGIIKQSLAGEMTSESMHGIQGSGRRWEC